MAGILVPVDGSENSMRALKAAVKHINPASGTKILLLNVQPDVPTAVQRYLSEDFIKTYYDEESKRALLDAITFLHEKRIPHLSYTRIGQAAETIAAFATEMQTDQIVMGTRGVGTLSRLLLGSVANKVLSLVDIPVTLVK